jgi:putative DNA primase/helicase
VSPPDGPGRPVGETEAARGSVSEETTHRIDRRTALHDYLTACLGDTEGYLHVAFGSDPYLDNGKYKHRRWDERAYAWPAEADRAEGEILTASEQSDVYVCPYLMRGRKRAKWAAVAHILVHADVDTDLDLEKVRGLGGFAVSSGTRGHAHVYVSLAESVTGPKHEALCRGLGKFLGAVDTKCSDNDFLRPPGTRNFKPTVSGGAATAVGMEERP